MAPYQVQNVLIIVSTSVFVNLGKSISLLDTPNNLNVHLSALADWKDIV